MSVYQVGVVGYGLSAKVFQIPYVQASARFALRAIVHRSGTLPKADHPDVAVYKTVEELVGDDKIDLVILSTPPQTHFELAKKALEGEKNVVVEKPFCPTAAECDSLIALARQNKVVLSVFQNRRWDADFLTLQEILANKAIGNVLEFETHFDRYSPKPRLSPGLQPGTGVAYDLGTHLIDQVLVLYGMPSRVTGFLRNQRGQDAAAAAAPDACTILLEYESGLLVTVKASAMSAVAEQVRYWVRGESGSFYKAHLDPQEPQSVAGMPITDPNFGKEDPSHSGSLTVYKDGKMEKTVYPNVTPALYTRYFDLLAAAIDGTGEAPVTAESARNVIHIVELAIKSSAEGASQRV